MLLRFKLGLSHAGAEAPLPTHVAPVPLVTTPPPGGAGAPAGPKTITYPVAEVAATMPALTT